MANTLVRNITACSRCGNDHAELEMRPLARPIAPPEMAPFAWTHWAPCPANGDPLIFGITTGAPADVNE